MAVATSRFGEIEMDERKVISIPQGILGFSDEKRYFFVDHKDTPFKWLQAVNNPELAFVTIDPLMIDPDYHINILRDEVEDLEIQKENDVMVVVIVSIYRDPAKITANLQGPLVINTRNKIGKQIVLIDGKYSTRHPILSYLKKSHCVHE